MINLMIMCLPFAYIEPSAISYVVQAVAGTLIGLGAVVSLFVAYWKRKSAKLLNLDQNEKREVEEDIVIGAGEPKK